VTGSQPFSVHARSRSFRHAFRGLAQVIRTQHNAWIHAAATVLVIGCGVALGVSVVEWCLLVLAIAGVWCAEALNTALEALGDAVSREHHALLALAKDAAAGGVLVAAVGAAVIGALVLVPRLLELAE